MIDLKKEYQEMRAEQESNELKKFHERQMKLALLAQALRQVEKEHNCVLGYEVVRFN